MHDSGDPVKPGFLRENAELPERAPEMHKE
jgi:hypothetical protein